MAAVEYQLSVRDHGPMARISHDLRSNVSLFAEPTLTIRLCIMSSNLSTAPLKTTQKYHSRFLNRFITAISAFLSATTAAAAQELLVPPAYSDYNADVKLGLATASHMQESEVVDHMY